MIVGITGPEGSGKSLYMTYHAMRHYNRTRGKGVIWAFPGYELKDKNGHAISREMKLEDWIGLPDYLHDCLILIDEIQNHFNSALWNTQLTLLFTTTAAQRRKRRLTIIYTGQLWGEVPKRIRERTLVFYQCFDNHFKYKKVPAGLSINIKQFDPVGRLSGTPWNRARPQTFKGRRFWENYDSFQTSEVSMYDRVHVKGRDVELLPDGTVRDLKTDSDKPNIHDRLSELVKLSPGAEMTTYEIAEAIGETAAAYASIASCLRNKLNLVRKFKSNGDRVYTFPD